MKVKNALAYKLPLRRYLTREESAGWLSVCVDMFQSLGIPCVDLGPRCRRWGVVDTGGRRSEIFKLDWQNVDLDRGFVTFTKTKNGEDRSVRLTDRAMRILVGLGSKQSGPVFTYEGQLIKDVKTTFGKARKKAGLEDFRFHDLRHTFASWLVQKGISIYEVMNLTGHKSLVMVQRYAHLALAYQKEPLMLSITQGSIWAQSVRIRVKKLSPKKHKTPWFPKRF